jgi:HEAT repeat protein
MQTRSITLALLSTLWLGNALAGPPRIINTEVASRTAGADLRAEVASAGRGSTPRWLAWSLPSIDARYQMCCFNGDWSNFQKSCCATCRLDGSSNNFSNRNGDEPPAAGGTFTIFVRASGEGADRVRTFSADCTIDADGASVTWLNGVTARQSVAYLASLVGTGDEDDSRGWKQPISAIAMIDDPSATDALENLTTASHSDDVRSKAVFWMASTRGRRGFEVARRLATAAGGSRLHEQAIFALSISHEPESTDTLIDIARNDHDSRNRGKALFWLSQKASKKAAGALRDAVERDPETRVKEQAVFGISQLPDDQSIPLLIEVIKSNRNPSVRKKAVFWLGQKNDPRALKAIEEILKN